MEGEFEQGWEDRVRKVRVERGISDEAADRSSDAALSACRFEKGQHCNPPVKYVPSTVSPCRPRFYSPTLYQSKLRSMDSRPTVGH